MTRRPNFDDLVEGVEDAGERERLRRVHELLVRTDAPPDLSLELETPPPAAAHIWTRPRRRTGPRFVLTAAAIGAAFLIGVFVGSPSGPRDEWMRDARTIALTSDGDATGAIGLGRRDDKGNFPMILTVTGLDRLHGGDYYRLALTKDGDPVVTCVTFNASGTRTTIRFVAAYDLKSFDGWVVTRWDAETHEEEPVLRAPAV